MSRQQNVEALLLAKLYKCVTHKHKETEPKIRDLYLQKQHFLDIFRKNKSLITDATPELKRVYICWKKKKKKVVCCSGDPYNMVLVFYLPQ